MFKSTLSDNYGYDESFGFNDLKIYYCNKSFGTCENEHIDKNITSPIEVLNAADNFSIDNWTSNASNKVDNLVTTCGGEKVLGGFNVGGYGVYFKRVFILPEHTRISVKFKGWMLDSWDNEKYIVSANSKFPIKVSFDLHDRSRRHICGNSYWKDETK